MENKSIIYCDFDGTVTKEDSVNKFLTLFADKKWLEVEEQWIQGEIGSKECLSKQVELVPALSDEELMGYVNSIEIDDYFVEFYNFLKNCNVELVILSDGFDFFIEKTLEKHNLQDIKYFANSLIVNDNKLSLEFNFNNPNCKNGSGTCKCNRTKIEDFCYIGDGLSDACIANKAGKLFAKNNLKKYCDKEKIDYINFETFKDILGHFSEEIDYPASKETNDTLLYFPGKRRLKCKI